MKLTVIQTLIIILAITVGTQISRWLPFLAFSGKKETPPFIKYLGRVLPPALMGLAWRLVLGSGGGGRCCTHEKSLPSCEYCSRRSRASRSSSL